MNYSPPSWEEIERRRDELRKPLREQRDTLKLLANVNAPPELVKAVASTPEERLERVLQVKAWRARHSGEEPPKHCSRQLRADEMVARLEIEEMQLDAAWDAAAAAKEGIYP